MQVNKLTNLVHANMDTVEFLEASEDHLRETLEAAKALIKTGKDPQVRGGGRGEEGSSVCVRERGGKGGT